jgi:hypothetical protein
MFRGLKYQSKWFQMPGVPRFKFTARYPTDQDFMEFIVRKAELQESFPIPKPSEAASDKGRMREENLAFYRLFADAAASIIEEMEVENGSPPEDWREQIAAEGRPFFLTEALYKTGEWLFRGATEQGDTEPT